MRMTESKSGLTLVEAMIAVLLLGVCLSAFVTAFTMARSSAGRAVGHMEHMHVARQALETIVSCNYDDSRLSVGAHTLSNGSYVVALNPTYLKTKDITLTVFWQQPGSSRTSTVSLATSMADAVHGE